MTALYVVLGWQAFCAVVLLAGAKIGLVRVTVAKPQRRHKPAQEAKQ